MAFDRKLHHFLKRSIRMKCTTKQTDYIIVQKTEKKSELILKTKNTAPSKALSSQSLYTEVCTPWSTSQVIFIHRNRLLICARIMQHNSFMLFELQICRYIAQPAPPNKKAFMHT